mmetsp:Transcript_41647/g.132457  ORF Transcript_41647/g.132457 Transcript_41647/m.132457 type:complete len:239 (+) Transcript_41647:56-772(+)
MTALVAGTRPLDVPLNPFESTFELLRALRDEIHELRAEVSKHKEASAARFEKVEGDIESCRSAQAAGFGALQQAMKDERQARNERFDKMAAMVEDITADKRVRLDQLDAQVKAEMNLRFEQNQVLERRLRTEVAQLKAHWEKTTAVLDGHRQQAESATLKDRQRHDELRQDVEKLAVLLSDSSLTRDPFSVLGYRPSTPSAPCTHLGSTAHGGSLPPLMGTSVRGSMLAASREGASSR